MKTAVITGASKGIGLATAKLFLANGWRVIGTYGRTPSTIEDANFSSVLLDQGSPESIASAVEEIKKLAPHVDALINNAAVLLDAGEPGIDQAKLRQTFEVDLFGLIDLTERLLPLMGEGSYVVNIDSEYGSFSFPIDDSKASTYRLAKTALNQYTRILACRTAPQGLIIASLDPGWVKTSMGQSVASETEGPDRDPSGPAGDILALVSEPRESGFFWQAGKKRPW